LVDYDTKYSNGSGTPLNIDYIDATNPKTPFANCNTVKVGSGSGSGNTGGEDRMRGFINGTITPIADLPNKPLADGTMLKEKIQEGYNYFFDLSPNYDLAIRDLTEALNAPFTTEELADWSVAITDINSQLLEAFSEGLNEGGLVTYQGSGGTDYNEMIINIINLQDKLLIDFIGDDQQTFKVLLAKASLYRILGNLETSEQILNEISRELYPEMNAILESFNCMVKNEKLLTSGQLTFNEFEQSYQCSAIEDYSLLPPPYIEELEEIELIKNQNTNSEVSNPIKIYPNPSNGTFNLKFKGIEATEYSIEIVDIIGKKVYNSSGMVLLDNNILLDLSLLNSGTYFLKMVNGKDVQTKQLVIVK
jgi:hypothetical protein